MAVIRPPMPHLAFTMVPTAWVRDPDLPQGPKALLVYYLSHAEGYRCSVAQAARELGVGRDTVGTQNKKLRQLGYLVNVEQQRGDRGRWAENDYAISCHTHGIPPRPTEEELSENPTLPGMGVSSGTVPVFTGPVGPGTVNPPRSRSVGEDQLIPSGSAAAEESSLNGNGHQPTINQRARLLTNEHYEACGRMENWNAVNGIVIKALKADHGDESVRKALAELRGSGMSVATATLRNALARPGSGGRGQSRNASGRTQWEPRERGTYTDIGDGTF